MKLNVMMRMRLMVAPVVVMKMDQLLLRTKFQNLRPFPPTSYVINLSVTVARATIMDIL